MNQITSDTENEYVYDCVIIGSGISGLSFAHYLQSIGQKTLILEKNSNIGGRIKTINADIDSKYWRELGAHTCYNSYAHLLSIAFDIGYKDHIQPLSKCSYVLYSDNKIRSVISELSLLPMALRGSRIFFTSREGKTVKEYFSPIIGQSNYDHLFTNLFRAVVCQDADDYPAEVFLKRRKTRVKEVARKFSFKGGLLSFLNQMVLKDRLSVVTECEVLEIKQDDESYSVHTSQGEIIQTRKIALAANPQMAAKLLENVDKPISKLLGSISLFSSESVNVIVRKDALTIESAAGIIPLSGEFMSAVSRDVLEHPDLRSFTFHFEKGKKNIYDKLLTVCNVLGVKKDDIIEHTMATHVLPSLRKEHLNLADQIAKKRTCNDVFVLGNYFYGLSLEDCIHRSFDEFKRFR